MSEEIVELEEFSSTVVNTSRSTSSSEEFPPLDLHLSMNFLDDNRKNEERASAEEISLSNFSVVEIDQYLEKEREMRAIESLIYYLVDESRHDLERDVRNIRSLGLDLHGKCF